MNIIDYMIGIQGTNTKVLSKHLYGEKAKIWMLGINAGKDARKEIVTK
jgi:hypothetical protein